MKMYVVKTTGGGTFAVHLDDIGDLFDIGTRMQSVVPVNVGAWVLSDEPVPFIAEAKIQDIAMGEGEN